MFDHGGSRYLEKLRKDTGCFYRVALRLVKRLCLFKHIDLLSFGCHLFPVEDDLAGISGNHGVESLLKIDE